MHASPGFQGHGRGHGGGRGRERHMAALRKQIAAQPAAPLSEDETHDLLHMHEEEKIARDVYLRLGERWNLAPFQNIPASEQAHMDAIGLLLAHHGLPDQVQGLPTGRFRTAAFQTLHDQLVDAGLSSEVEAIRVGLLIEELDIVDLQQARARTRNPAITAVFDNLERGSRNHLRAFYRHLQRHGARYTPQHLDAQDFEAIARSAHEDCDSDQDQNA